MMKNKIYFVLFMMCYSWSTYAMDSHESTQDTLSFLKAAETGDFGLLQELLKKNSDLIKSVNQNNETALHLAIWNHHQIIYQYLIEAGADLEVRDKNFETPLSWAASHGEVLAISSLLSRQVKLEVQDQGGRTPLSWAAGNNNPEAVRYLLERGAQVDIQDQGGRTPLSWAAQGLFQDGNRTFFDLLERSTQVDHANREGRTPLSFVAERGDLERMSALITRGANLEVQDHHGRTPLFYMVLKCSAEFLLKFYEKYPNFQSKILECLKETLGITACPEARNAACKALFLLDDCSFNPAKLCGIPLKELLGVSNQIAFARRCQLYDPKETYLISQNHLRVNLERLGEREPSDFPAKWIQQIKNEIIENKIFPKDKNVILSAVIRKIIGQEVGLLQEEGDCQDEWIMTVFSSRNLPQCSDWKTYLFLKFLSYYDPTSLIKAFQEKVTTWMRSENIQSYEKLIEIFGQENLQQSYFNKNFQVTSEGAQAILLRYGYLIAD